MIVFEHRPYQANVLDFLIRLPQLLKDAATLKAFTVSSKRLFSFSEFYNIEEFFAFD